MLGEARSVGRIKRNSLRCRWFNFQGPKSGPPPLMVMRKNSELQKAVQSTYWMQLVHTPMEIARGEGMGKDFVAADGQTWQWRPFSHQRLPCIPKWTEKSDIAAQSERTE